MLVFYDPTNNQVMALFTNGTTSPAWDERGYQRLEVSDPDLERVLQKLGRDARLSFTNGTVSGASAQSNALQPNPTPKTERELAIERLAALPSSTPVIDDIIKVLTQRD